MPHFETDDGTRIHYLISGEGAPVCLIPGLGGEGGFWSGVVDGLAARVPATLIRPDHRGAGQSDRPHGPYSIPRIARDVVGLLDHLNLRDTFLIGHSTGGMIAQTIATAAPGRVRALVLSGTWDRPDLRFRRMFEARMALLEHGGAVAYHKLTQALGYDGVWLDTHAEAMESELHAAEARLSPVDVQLARMRMLLTHDCYDKLPDIACPTLVIGSQCDGLIPHTHSERLAERIPGAVLETLTGGHFYPRSHPEDFVSALVPFLEAHT